MRLNDLNFFMPTCYFEHFYDVALNLSSIAIDWAGKKNFRITLKDNKRFLKKKLNDLCKHFS